MGKGDLMNISNYVFDMNREFYNRIGSRVRILSNNVGCNCEVIAQMNESVCSGYFVTKPKLSSINQAAIDQLSCS